MSKKIFFIILSIFFAVTVAHETEAAEKQYISINDELINLGEPELIREGNILYAPLGKVTEMLGGRASATADRQEVTISIGKNKLYFNKKTGVSTRNGIRLNAKEIRLFKQITYVSIPYLATINGFHFEKITGYPLTQINTSNKKLALDALNKKKPPLVKKNKPTVYLTFDDGPNKYTTQNLATLKKYKARATFFFIGNQLNNQQNIVKQAAKEGHYIGLHSMTHDRKKVYASPKAFINEMNTQNNLYKKIIGKYSTLARAPYGSKPYLTSGMRNELKAKKIKLWDWDVDTVDWKYSQQAYKQIITNTQNGIKKAEKKKDQHIVVLLHDRLATATALPYILDWLNKEGYNVEVYDPTKHTIQNFWQDKSL